MRFAIVVALACLTVSCKSRVQSNEVYSLTGDACESSEFIQDQNAWIESVRSRFSVEFYYEPPFDKKLGDAEKKRVECFLEKAKQKSISGFALRIALDPALRDQILTPSKVKLWNAGFDFADVSTSEYRSSISVYIDPGIKSDDEEFYKTNLQVLTQYESLLKSLKEVTDKFSKTGLKVRFSGFSFSKSESIADKIEKAKSNLDNMSSRVDAASAYVQKNLTGKNMKVYFFDLTKVSFEQIGESRDRSISINLLDLK